jgi:hypothetical protein
MENMQVYVEVIREIQEQRKRNAVGKLMEILGTAELAIEYNYQWSKIKEHLSNEYSRGNTYRWLKRIRNNIGVLLRHPGIAPGLDIQRLREMVGEK